MPKIAKIKGENKLAATPGTPKSDFLQSVRRALGREPGAPTPAHPALERDLLTLEREAEEARQRIAAHRGALLDRLAETAQLRGWRTLRTPDPEEAATRALSLAEALGASRIVRSSQEVFDLVPVDAALTGAGVTVTEIAHGESRSREALRAEIIAAGLGITGADYAIAETGSVIVRPRKGLSRLVSLVPPVHLALVRAEDVIESLDDLFLLRLLEYHAKGGDMGRYLNFITGPSRTADIEQTLVVGVHGPKEAHMILLG